MNRYRERPVRLLLSSCPLLVTRQGLFLADGPHTEAIVTAAAVVHAAGVQIEAVVPRVPQFLLRRAEQVDAAVADVGGIPHVGRAEDAREGGAHLLQLWLCFEKLVQVLLHLIQFLLDFHLADGLRFCENLQHGLHHEGRGTLAKVVAAHAVAHGEQARGTTQAVLVIGSFPLLGEFLDFHINYVLL